MQKTVKISTALIFLKCISFLSKIYAFDNKSIEITISSFLYWTKVSGGTLLQLYCRWATMLCGRGVLSYSFPSNTSRRSSQEIREIIPVPLRHVRTTRSSTHSHPFHVSLSNPQTLSQKSSFIPRTCNLWNILPFSCFPESYNLPTFKSKINKFDLISLSS